MKKLIPILVIAVGMIISFSVLAQTSGGELEAKTINITYPVAELGNCTSKSECKTFCDNPENIEACVAFAEGHGLMNQDQAERATKFSASFRVGDTPGGCTTPENCKKFCSSVTNIEVCTDWAEKNGINDRHFEEAKKIRDYLKSGGSMPGGCTSETICRTYCEDFNNADECIAFAEKVGLDVSGKRPSKQVFELMKSGQTPGGCQSKSACETYCQDENHFEECVAFAERAGFMSAREAELARETGGSGPGGCRGRECENYCNDPTHQEECFSFAEEHGLIPKEDLERAKEGLVRMRIGLEGAPDEVKECLRANLGTNIIEDIQGGKLTPGPQIGERMRECFERFGESHRPQDALKDIPPEVVACVREKGIDVESIKLGEGEFTPEVGDTIRICFKSFEFNRGSFGQSASGVPSVTGSVPPNLGSFFRSAPPQVVECLQSSLGTQFESLKSGEEPTDPLIAEKMRGCFDQFRPQEFRPDQSDNPQNQPENFFPARPSPVFPGSQGSFDPTQILGQFPEQVVNCIKSNLTENDLTDPARVRVAAEKCFARSDILPSKELPRSIQGGQINQPGFRLPQNFPPSAPPPTGLPSDSSPGSYQYHPSLLGVVLSPLIDLLY